MDWNYMVVMGFLYGGFALAGVGILWWIAERAPLIEDPVCKHGMLWEDCDRCHFTD